jgi:hypothetical protein
MGGRFNRGEISPHDSGDARDFDVPIELAELMHALLGTLADVLEDEGHSWAQMTRRVLDEYEGQRNRILISLHGESIMRDLAHHTEMAVEKLCKLTDSAVQEASDFIQWHAEVSGESA